MRRPVLQAIRVIQAYASLRARSPFACVATCGRSHVHIVQPLQMYQQMRTFLSKCSCGLQLPGTITKLACKGDLTFAAVGDAVHVCRRIHLAASWHTGGSRVVDLLVMGDYVVVACSDGKVLLFEVSTLSPEPVVRTQCAWCMHACMPWLGPCMRNARAEQTNIVMAALGRCRVRKCTSGARACIQGDGTL